MLSTLIHLKPQNNIQLSFNNQPLHSSRSTSMVLVEHKGFVAFLHSLGNHSTVDLKRYSYISEVYWSRLHSLVTRSAVEFLKVFTTNKYIHIYTRYIEIQWNLKTSDIASIDISRNTSDFLV